MELMHQLTPKLKQLRLSGVLETLDVRHRQAIDSQWTHVEFLARLLEDEVERRAQKQLALRTRRATVNTAKTLENYDFAFNPMVKRAQVLQLASCDYIRQKQNVLVIWPRRWAMRRCARASMCSSSTPTRCSSICMVAAPTARSTSVYRSTCGQTCSFWMTSASSR